MFIFRTLYIVYFLAGCLLGREFGASACSSAAQCREACQNSTISDDVVCDVDCSRTYGRCACRGGSALRMDATCAKSLNVPSSLCHAESEALFNMALVSSPEVRISHLYRSGPSDALVSIIRRSVGSALSRSPLEVVLANATVTPMLHKEPKDISDAQGRILHFDLSFKFCTSGSTPILHPTAFQRAFIREAQRYRAFYLGTVVLLSLSPSTLSASTATEAPKRSERSSSDACVQCGDSSPRPGSGTNALVTTMLALLPLCAVVGGALLVLSLAKRRRQRKWQDSVKFMDEMFALPDGIELGIANEHPRKPTALDGEPEAAIAYAVASFAPSDEHAAAFGAGGALNLEEGDVVEVVAAAGGWLYGRIVDSDIREGFFPENCVTWLGRPINCDPQSVVDPSRDSFAEVDVALGTPSGSPTGRFSTGAIDMSFAAFSSAPVQSDSMGDSMLCAGDAWTPPTPPQFPQPTQIGAGHVDEEQEQPGSAEETSTSAPGASYLARTIAGFQPAEMELESSSLDVLLPLSDGDIVHVTGGSDGWLYGSVVGFQERAGYFPEDRVRWLS
eukprot:TRINITY_DN54670_c0_g1_i1.p1 TRINITY_DN54670_c0_g1~~TRINITY_DN54670_c0_g1_i1.p1  ORF type:complete len:561 (-),score=89.26 TRINITY_DN54670_c0_g1_i1:165-1847(-)